MNTSQYMDKQIMDLSSSSTSNHLQGSSSHSKDFLDLNTQDDHHVGANVAAEENGIKREEIFASYDFQPIRAISASSRRLDGNGAGSTGNLGSIEAKINCTITPTRKHSSFDTTEPSKVIVEEERKVLYTEVVAEVDRAMKKHSDNLLHILEGVSARLTQLESQTRNFENSIDDLKVFYGHNQGPTDGKMKQLESILREVQTGLDGIKDKQERVEVQLRLCNIQVSDYEQRSETQKGNLHVDPAHQAASAPPQSHLQPPPHPTFSQSIPFLMPPPQQNLPPTAQPTQFPQNQIPSVPQRDSYYFPPGQTQEASVAHYPPPAAQAIQSSPAPPSHQPYQPTLQPQFPHLHQPNQPPHSEEEAPYMHVNYQPNARLPLSQPSTRSSPSQQCYGVPTHLYAPQSNRPSSGFSSETYPYSGQPQYGGSSRGKSQQLSGSGYPQLPTARVLPQVLPTASGVGSGLEAAGSDIRVPVDDVIDKVTTMGFPRDHVRAMVRKLTENGQSVELNVVLDKLMKGSGS